MRKAIQKSKSGVVTRRDDVARLGISLDARGVIAGITFHLLDEGLAESVCPESARRSVDRLVAEGAAPVEVSHSLWGEMSNAERLAWLLASSETEFCVAADGVARLGARGR